MSLSKVLTRGQITLPKDVRKAAGIEPGDTVFVHVTGPGKVELSVLPRLTLAELWERYKIEGPIDWAKDSEHWEAEAAKDVISE